MFFNFALKFKPVNEFFRGQKIMEPFLNLSFFFFDATAIYRDANRRLKVHRVVLIYSLISRQPPFCVFDDAFNLSVYHANIVVEFPISYHRTILSL